MHNTLLYYAFMPSVIFARRSLQVLVGSVIFLQIYLIMRHWQVKYRLTFYQVTVIKPCRSRTVYIPGV